MDIKIFEPQLLAYAKTARSIFSSKAVQDTVNGYSFSQFYPVFEKYICHSIKDISGIYINAGEHYSVTELTCEWSMLLVPLDEGMYKIWTRIVMSTDERPAYKQLGFRFDANEDESWSKYATDNEIDHFFHRLHAHRMFKPLMAYHFDNYKLSISLCESSITHAYVVDDKVEYVDHDK